MDKKELKEKAKGKAKSTFAEFKEFALKGNIMDLAIGMVMGAAFTAIVTAIVDNVFSPLIGALTSGINLAELSVTVGGVEFVYGAVINAIVSFLIISLVMFLIVKALAKASRKDKEEVAATTKTCPYCKSEIDIEATRCPHCTSQIEE